MSIKLIIADDAPFILEILKNHLQPPEFEIIDEATNGEEVVEMFKKHNSDIIIMDIVMPKKNGIEAMEEILSENSNVKIITCSTLDDPAITKEVMSKGAVDCITKPFTKNQLIDSVRRAFKATRSE